MKYEKYLIKKDKLDLLSSLKALDKKLLNKKLKEFGVENIKELKEYIIDSFEMCLELSKDDIFTQIYFQRLLENENTEWMSAYQDDIEGLWVFIYENKGHYSYYIPTEIKKIIKNILNDMPMENNMSYEEKINLENAADTPIIKDLKALLNTLVIKDLKHIGELFVINRLSNKPKKELVNIIYNTLANEEKIIEVIERFIDKEFNLLKELMRNKGTIQNNNISMEEYHFLYMLGIVFLFKRNNKFYISMTDDVYNILKKLDLNKFNKIIEENTRVYNLLKSMIELYGVVSYGDLDYAYNEYYGKNECVDIPRNSLYFCDRCDNIKHIFTEHNSYFINRILDKDELEPMLDDIIERQTKIAKKKIKLEELLKYADYSYYEDNTSRNKFKKYLKTYDIPNEIIEEMIMLISKMYRLGNDLIDVSIEMLEDYGVEIDMDNIKEILEFLNDIYNNTRVWSNNGWTPIEMRKNYKI